MRWTPCTSLIFITKFNTIECLIIIFIFSFCKTCHIFAPRLCEVVMKNGGEVLLVRVNVDEKKHISNTYKVSLFIPLYMTDLLVSIFVILRSSIDLWLMTSVYFLKLSSGWSLTAHDWFQKWSRGGQICWFLARQSRTRFY